MSAILILLALLSVATLASHRGYAAFVAHIVTTPLLLILGVLIAPGRLAILTPSTTDALIPALRVGCAWLALLVGLRTIRPRLARQYLGDLSFTLVVGGMCALLLAGLTFGVSSLLTTAGYPFGGGELHDARPLLGMALLLGGVVSSSGFSFTRDAVVDVPETAHVRRVLFLGRHDELLGAAALCFAVWLWPLPAAEAPVYAMPELAAVVVIVLGVALATSLGFAGGALMGGPSATWIALLGLLTLATGLSASTRLPEAGIALVLGVTAAGLGLSQDLGEDGLARTERPVRLVVLVLIGTQLSFSPWNIAVGVLLAFARLLLKALLRLVMNARNPSPIPLSALLGSSGATLPLTLSFALTRTSLSEHHDLLTAAAICVSLTDLFTLLVWRRNENATHEPLWPAPPSKEPSP